MPGSCTEYQRTRGGPRETFPIDRWLRHHCRSPKIGPVLGMFQNGERGSRVSKRPPIIHGALE